MNPNDSPAFPQPIVMDRGGNIHSGSDRIGGLTKLEAACIHLRIPKSGNAGIDALIVEAQRRDIAVAVLQGMLANSAWINSAGGFAVAAIKQANELLGGLE